MTPPGKKRPTSYFGGGEGEGRFRFCFWDVDACVDAEAVFLARGTLLTERDIHWLTATPVPLGHSRSPGGGGLGFPRTPALHFHTVTFFRIIVFISSGGGDGRGDAGDGRGARRTGLEGGDAGDARVVLRGPSPADMF